MTPCEPLPETGVLYHVIDDEAVEEALAKGLPAGSRWSGAVEPDATETVLSLPMATAPGFPMVPDRKAVCADDDVWGRWQASGKTWKDSLEIAGSCVCASPLPPTVLTLEPRPAPTVGP